MSVDRSSKMGIAESFTKVSSVDLVSAAATGSGGLFESRQKIENQEDEDMNEKELKYMEGLGNTPDQIRARQAEQKRETELKEAKKSGSGVVLTEADRRQQVYESVIDAPYEGL